MSITPEPPRVDEIDPGTRIIHLGLMVFGVLAWLVSGWADDYKRARHLGFTIHSWLGMGLSISIALRLVWGLIGPEITRFTRWVPYTKERLLVAWEDGLNLLKFQLPQRPLHQGLSGLVHAFGLVVFSWMALTGTLMYIYVVPGHKMTGILRLVKELHEMGDVAIWVFLGLHVGAVLLHALAGEHRWRKMLFLTER